MLKQLIEKLIIESFLQDNIKIDRGYGYRYLWSD
jgi:hypothetical protein